MLERKKEGEKKEKGEKERILSSRPSDRDFAAGPLLRSTAGPFDPASASAKDSNRDDVDSATLTSRCHL